MHEKTVLSDHTQPKVPRYPQIMANQKSLKPPKKNIRNVSETRENGIGKGMRKSFFARAFSTTVIVVVAAFSKLEKINFFPHVSVLLIIIFIFLYFHINFLIKALSLDNFPMRYVHVVY